MNMPTMVKPGVLALVTLALAVVADVFFLDHQWGIVVPIFTALFLGVVVLFDRLSHRRLSWFESSLAVLMLLLSIFFALRDSDALLALNAVAMLYLGGLMLVSIYGAEVRQYNLWDFVAFPFVDGIIAVVNGAGIFGHFKTYKSNQWARVGLGVALGLVVLLIFGALFAAADEVFRVLLDRAFNFELKDVLDDAALIIALFVGFLLLFAPAFWKRTEVRNVVPWHASRSIGVESTIVLSVLNALFLLFVAIQGVYLFGGEQNLASLGLTYAEYARQGFYQLLVVAALVVGIMWLLRMFHMGRYRMATNVLQTVLVVLTGGVLASSWIRLSLYEQAFGFTRDRLSAHFFLVVIAVVLILFLVGLSHRVKENQILRGVIFALGIGLFVFNIINPDALIARQNVARGDSGRPMDLAYLVTLSEDAVPAIAAYVEEHMDEQRELAIQLKAARDEQYQLKRELRQICNSDAQLCAAHEQRIALLKVSIEQMANADGVASYDNWKKNYEYASDWQSWNMSRWRAKILRVQLP